MPFNAAGADLEIQTLGSVLWGEGQWYLPGAVGKNRKIPDGLWNYLCPHGAEAQSQSKAHCLWQVQDSSWWQSCGMCLLPGAQWEQRCICAGAMGRGLELPENASQWE